MAVKTQVAKKRKKSWVKIVAPQFLGNAFLGESLVQDKEDLVGKYLSLNLSTFTNDMKKQSIIVKFRAISVVDNQAQTNVVGLELTNSYMKRLVRRGKSKVSDSFVANTRDNKKLRIKPLIITNSKTNNSLQSKIRVEAKALILESVKKLSADEFFENIINTKIQRDLKDKLSKIYPLRYVDMYKCSIEK
ncbi:MAG: hypothetical protein ACMXX6_00910 [Candidatus Woesearchaeota archaeon]